MKLGWKRSPQVQGLRRPSIRAESVLRRGALSAAAMTSAATMLGSGVSAVGEAALLLLSSLLLAILVGFLKRFAGSNLVSQDGLLLFPFGGKNEPKFAPA